MQYMYCDRYKTIDFHLKFWDDNFTHRVEPHEQPVLIYELPGITMLIAALLFMAGLALGWRYDARAVVIASIVIVLCSSPVVALMPGVVLLKALVIAAYLLAHQSGYMVGAFLSHRRRPDRTVGIMRRNQVARLTHP